MVAKKKNVETIANPKSDAGFARSSRATSRDCCQKKLVLVRIRGCTGIRREVEDTMKMLCLTRVNHCSLADESPQTKGMIQRCKDYITWGEVEQKTLAKLLEKRGRLPGDARVTVETLKEKGFESFSELAGKLIASECSLEGVGLKKVFRLNPPSKGFGSIKLAFPRGALGSRGAGINALLERMM
ncbi:50S ribosomal protein L30 [Candidatus Micrarchaeota archaeon]|nr:50S ribosomal protein L30 [Candidatus Micrarchaeota archaeon]